jgi:hypothetical protein
MEEEGRGKSILHDTDPRCLANRGTGAPFARSMLGQGETFHVPRENKFPQLRDGPKPAMQL